MNYQQYLGKKLIGLKEPLIDKAQIDLWSEYLVINPFEYKPFDYFDDIIISFLNNEPLPVNEINLCGSRYGTKTYSTLEAFCAKLIAACIANDKKVAIYGFRKLGADLIELRQEIDNALDNIGLIQRDNVNSKGHYLFTNGQNKPTWKFVGGSFITLKGLYKSGSTKIALKGLASCKDFDLAISICEEANEINKSEFQAVDFAIRGAKQELQIKMSNPDSIFQDYIAYCAENLPFNKELLLQNGEMYKMIKEKNINKMFHYTNFRINPYLTRDKINQLMDLEKRDPIKYNVWGNGMPGNIEGSIFGYYLTQLTNDPLHHFIPIKIVSGLDLGQADTPSGHPTFGNLIGINEFGVCKLLSEYTHNNAISSIHKTPTDIATDLIHFYINQVSKYPNIVRDNLIVKVDYGAGGAYMIEILKTIKNKIANELRINLDWLIFRPVIKSMYYIKDRIDAFQTLISLDMFKIDPNLTPYSIKQLGLMVWKEQSVNAGNDSLKPLDKFDDAFDAICYAIMDELDKIKEQMPHFIGKTKIM